MQELLVALKQVLGTEFRRGLFPLIDTLLEERYCSLGDHWLFLDFTQEVNWIIS